MKIAILSRDGSLYSCMRLREAAEARKHVVDIIDPLSCYMNINSAAPTVHYRGRQLVKYDAVIPRIGSQITFYGTAVLRQFEMLGSFALNNALSITLARQQLHSLQLLAREGIDLPIIAKRLNFDYTIWTENKLSVSQPISLFLLFACAHLCSIGLRSGEYVGKYSTIYPASMMTC